MKEGATKTNLREKNASRHPRHGNVTKIITDVPQIIKL